MKVSTHCTYLLIMKTNDEITVQSSLFINIFVMTQDSVFFQTCVMQSIQSNGPLPYYNKWSLRQTNLKCHKFISYTFSFVITDNKAYSYMLILPVKNQTDICKKHSCLLSHIWYSMVFFVILIKTPGGMMAYRL